MFLVSTHLCRHFQNRLKHLGNPGVILYPLRHLLRNNRELFYAAIDEQTKWKFIQKCVFRITIKISTFEYKSKADEINISAIFGRNRLETCMSLTGNKIYQGTWRQKYCDTATIIRWKKIMSDIYDTVQYLHDVRWLYITKLARQKRFPLSYQFSAA